ncbi:Two-component sensor histidine kinase, contains HisKA and HATPase domains [Mucilaginibacter gossypii]|uniref:histidine kinase n=1 Tax=Mucilaginibacter gossypii TaxID=551996 RepID=A0A1G8ABS5_9SPHI|nr:Two-component sensor histidine kinase, contains HisKA and HATPase domains [Mucilaginibacter gossypii]
MKRSLVRHCFILFLLCCLSLSAYAQDFKTLTTELNKTQQDTNRVVALIKLGRYFKEKPVGDRKNLDTARSYFNSAITLSQAIGSTDFLQRALSEKALVFILQEDFKNADSLFNQITSYYNKTDNYSKEAEYWTLYGNNLSYDDKRTLAIRAKCYDKAYVLYKKGTDRLKIADALGKIADADLNEGRFDKAEKELLSVIQQYKAIKFPRIYYGYYLLAEVYSRKDQPQKELLSRIECMNSCDADVHRSDYDASFFHIALASSYRENNKDSSALSHYIKAAELAFKIKDQKYYYDAVDGAIASSIAIKRYKTALAYLNNTPTKFPTQTIEEQSMYVARKMQLYNFLNRNAEAGKFVPTFKKVFNKLYHTLNDNPSFYLVDQFVKNYDGLPQHYIQTQEWGNLSEELKFIQSLPLKRLSAPSRIIISGYKYKVDSAGGKFDIALKEFQYMRRMKDSLTNAATAKQINELEANYNSIKKDKTIQVLNSNAQVQKDKLEKANRQKNITLAGVLISVVFAVIIYIAYRAKQRSNVRLQIKQQEIDNQNHKLSDLLAEKEILLIDKDTLLKQQEDLLTEKEWLLREVHHRVKNNLQIVMSLLYTQSAYLQNTDAIEAIQDSRNRVQAISIIHQKLYSKSNVATIVMADYINDLTRYLNTCYDCNRRRIKFREELDTVNLDIAQAVPMGLILNEAITNSIKYGFDEMGGEIFIKARLSLPDMITLSVTDNGKGLPPDFKLAETSSLGMEMMKALSKQLGGSFEIKSSQGVVVTIQFKIENTSATISGNVV